MAFGGGFEAKHEFAPSGVAGSEVVGVLEPASVEETKKGAGFGGFEMEVDARASPFLAGFDEPFGAIVREEEFGAKTVDRVAIEESEFDCFAGNGDVFGPPLGETAGGGDERVNGFGGERDLDGVEDVWHGGSFGWGKSIKQKKVKE